MSATTPVEIRKHVRTYMLVFAALAVLTVVTVAVSYLHLPTPQAVALAMVIALVKGSLVAAFFMHLISERQTIYWVLGLCVAFFAVLMLIPTLNELDMIATPHAEVVVQAPAHGEAAPSH